MLKIGSFIFRRILVVLLFESSNNLFRFVVSYGIEKISSINIFALKETEIPF